MGVYGYRVHLFAVNSVMFWVDWVHHIWYTAKTACIIWTERKYGTTNRKSPITVLRALYNKIPERYNTVHACNYTMKCETKMQSFLFCQKLLWNNEKNCWEIDTLLWVELSDQIDFQTNFSPLTLTLFYKRWVEFRNNFHNIIKAPTINYRHSKKPYLIASHAKYFWAKLTQFIKFLFFSHS